MGIRCGENWLGRHTIVFLRLCTALTVCSFYGLDALAQESLLPEPQANTTDSKRTYSPDYFKQYSPRTAADMLARLPGFSVQSVDDKRGFGTGGINVLINGIRLSSKSNDAQSALTRIVAPSVIRIEIFEGARSDIPGLSGNVANIITRQDELSGSWKYLAKFQKRSRSLLNGGDISLSGKKGQFDFNIGIANQPIITTEFGDEFLLDAYENVIEVRDERASLFDERPKISTELTYNGLSGSLAHMNASVQLKNQKINDFSIKTALTAAGEDGERLISVDLDGWAVEVGGDYSFDFLKGRLKLISIGNFGHDDSSTIVLDIPNLTTADRTTFDQVSNSQELIARAEYSFDRTQNHDVILAIEGAFNTLDVDALLQVSDGNGDLVTIPFTNSSTRVEERRAEVSATQNWKFNPQTNVQLTVGGEYSELKQIGPSGLTRDFIRPKGSISLSYAPRGDFGISASIEREVGQLDFDTFVSSVELSNQLRSEGNPDIVPQQSWIGDVEVQKQWSNGISGTARIYAESITDIVDRIPLSDGSDAPGNIDKGTVLGLELTGTLELASFGLEGARIDLSYEVQDNSLTDPLTNSDRRFNRSLLNSYIAEFRYDIPNSNLAFGGYVDNYKFSKEFRLDQIIDRRSLDPDFGLFAEHKNIKGLTVKFEATDILQTEATDNRTIWAGGNRQTGFIDRFQRRARTSSPNFSLSITGSF